MIVYGHGTSHDPFVMVHLFTNNDPYLIHKTLGLFASGESKGFQGFCVIVHVALLVMSMFLTLPPKRNFWIPMI